MMMGSREVSLATEDVVRDLWRARHAVALCGFGGGLECCADAIVSTVINCLPQHGQGSARTRGGTDPLHCCCRHPELPSLETAPAKPQNANAKAALRQLSVR
jgi:hypothetical protein